jgi:hypothetical protein
MKAIERTFSFLLLATLVLAPLSGRAEAPSESAKTPPIPPAPEAPTANIDLTYRWLNIGGYPGRVGEYESLRQGFGGDLSFFVKDASKKNVFKYQATITSRDDYAASFQMQIGHRATVGVEASSLVRHPDVVPFGVNFSPDDILRTELIPSGTVLDTIRKTMAVNARVQVLNSPVSVFMKGDQQQKTGVAPLSYYDMGGDAACGSCHSVSRPRDLDLLTRHLEIGVEAKLKRVSLVYAHAVRTFSDREPNPVDFFGSTLSLPGDELPPGVPDTPQGNYVHNVWPDHRVDSDVLRVSAPLSRAISLNAAVVAGRAHNSFADNMQRFLNADATLHWDPVSGLRTTVDFHQQNTLNEFTPALYPLFGNPSLHRSRAGLRIGYDLSSSFDMEGHYRWGRVSRSDSELFPSIYSPDNLDIRRVIPLTLANTVGGSIGYHRGDVWRIRSGYEWTGTRDPGYLTDPGVANRLFLTGSFAPNERVSLSEDLSFLDQRSFPDIGRRNHLLMNATYLQLKPMADWSLTLGWAFSQNDLKTDLVYGTDPPSAESMVPFTAINRSYLVTSSWDITKRVNWDVDLSRVYSTSSFQPGLDDPFLPITSWAASFSSVDVPQDVAGTDLTCRWRKGFFAGGRFQYRSYRDRVHEELDGTLRIFQVFLGHKW